METFAYNQHVNKNEHVIIHTELCTSYHDSILLLMYDSFHCVNHM